MYYNKNHFNIILMLLYFTISLKLPAFSIEIIDPKFDILYMQHINIFKGQTAILGIVNDPPGNYKQGAVFIHENDKWTRLPDTIYSVGKFPIPITISSSINFDSTGNIWISGKHLYKFSGGKWQVFYKDDSDFVWRTYQQFCIDKFDNIWITTEVYHDTLSQYSELLKFDGSKFETVLKFNMPFSFARRGYLARSNGIAALSDGRVVVHRTLDIHEEDVKNGQTEDLYFINQDLTYKRVKLQTPSGSEYNNYNHIISSIYPETDGKIWFCLDYMTLSDSIQTTCCSGLEQQYNDIWTAYDESYGFEKVKANPKDVYKAIYFMERLDKENYFLLAEDCIYRFSKEYRLEKKEWLDVLNTPCKYIIPNSKWKESDVQESLKWFYNKMNATRPLYSGICSQANGEIWLQLGRGILVFNKDMIADIFEKKDVDSISLYPNPAKETIKFQTLSIITDYQIMDILGEKIKLGSNSSNQIDISELPEGMYIIKLWGLNQYSRTIKFIKTNF